MLMVICCPHTSDRPTDPRPSPPPLPATSYEGQQHRIWGCMNNMMLAWCCSASGHFWIAGMIYSGAFTSFNTGTLTLPCGFMQLGATITMLIHSVGATYGIPASWQMVQYEKKKAKALANGEDFKEVHHWWSDGSAIGSPFIVLLDSPMATWERVVLYLWYFIFGFGQLAMFSYLEGRGPTADVRAHIEDKETAFRFRWVLLVSGIGGVIQFFMALLHLDAKVQKEWALTQNLVGVTAFCIESVPLLANTFITLHVFLNPYYTFEDMEGLATAQVSTAMFCIVVMLVQVRKFRVLFCWVAAGSCRWWLPLVVAAGSYCWWVGRLVFVRPWCEPLTCSRPGVFFQLYIEAREARKRANGMHASSAS